MRNGLFERNDGAREMPGLNMASLPDLIFTVLFFFMIVTHMRHDEQKVYYQVPQGTELQKLGHKGSIVYIYVGRQPDTRKGEGDFFIQLNNRLAKVSDIKAFIEEERQHMSADDQARLTVSLKADGDVPMSIITDIKRELQQAYALKLNYSATEKANLKDN